MTQDSFPWGCNPATGDAGAVTVNDLVNAQQFGSNTSPNSDGVVYWTSTNPLPGGAVAVDGLLEASLAGNIVSIATGIGMVQGWNYVNDAVVDFDFNADPGNASATDLIVLERGDPAITQTVRIARVKGAPSSSATVTQSSVLWQVPLARVSLNGSGLPTNVVDERGFVGQIMTWRSGGNATSWDVPGTDFLRTGNVRIQGGIRSGTITNGGSSASVSINFWESFTNGHMAFAFVRENPVNLTRPLVINQVSQTNNSVTLRVRFADGGTAVGDTTFTINCIAIGEIN